MYRIYRTTKATIIGEETKSNDTKFQFITDLQGEKYVMVQNQTEHAIYELSFKGDVTENIPDVLFEDLRKMTYARLDKKWGELGFKPGERLI